MKYFFTFLLLLILSNQVYCNNRGRKPAQKDKRINYVDPFIGTSNAGNQVPGPLCPFGMVHPGPVNNGQHVPLATNYLYGNKTMYGFAMTNMAGVGCANYGSIIVMPGTGDLHFEDYHSAYSEESASPGYYSVKLDDSNVRVEMTATERSVLMKFHYPAGRANLLVDLSRRSSEDTAFLIRKVSPGVFEGYKSDGQFCAAGNDIHHRVYFVAEVSEAGTENGLMTAKGMLDEDAVEARGEDIGAYLAYDFEKPSVIEMKVGISYVSIENARMNLDVETTAYDF
ncbi:MAG TPA: hypothetical protein VE870_11230, partial [Bacteroidales bacterium]|nr:hypothetical protein [Bacteroidales bacterium]